MLGSAFAAQGSGEAHALALCDRLFAEHLSAIEERYGAPALGLADLPPLTGDTVEPAQLRLVPPLYWASEVEAAGLLTTVEALALGVIRGTFVEPIGDGIHLLVAFWRERNERFSTTERIAVFSHAFGGDGSPDPNTEFSGLFSGLMEALAALGTAPPLQNTSYLSARVASLASDLSSNLSMRTAGVTAFAAREIVASIREALAILAHADIAAALGGGSPWTIIERISPQLLGRSVSPRPHVARAVAGMRVLTWLADSGSSLGDSTAQVSSNDPVVQAALSWRAASGSTG